MGLSGRHHLFTDSRHETVGASLPQYSSNSENRCFTVIEDGRPQGAPPYINPTPVPTIYAGRAEAAASYSRDGGGVDAG
jgi:hypothetical protein